MRTKSIAIIFSALMLAAPLAVAADPWMYAGSAEPDNAFDSQAWMWTSPPLAAKNRVYFNAFSVTAGGIVSVGANVNVAALETHMQPSGVETYNAILGNWVDCNGDKYVGFGELGLREYDAALLTDPTLCPASTGDANAWDGSHNYNGWVTELVPIGTNGGQPSAAAGNEPDFEDDEFDLRIIRDSTAAVWGDYGLPDQAGGVIATCPIRPFPRGTVQSTGGLLDYTDCHSGRLGQFDPAPNGLLEAWNFAMDAAGDPLGLRFADDDNGYSGTLGGFGTLGSEDSSNAAVILTDCKADPVVDSSATFNETNEQFDLVSEDDQAFVDENTRTKIYPADPQTVDTSSPTIPGQINQTFEETGDCDTSNDDGHDTYGTVESDFEGTVATDKRQAAFNMEFEDNGILNMTPRGRVSDGFGILSAVEEEGEVDTSFPVHGGTSGMSLNNERVTHDWFARVALVKAAAFPGTRQNIGPAFDPFAPAEYITYYAFVGTNVTSAGYALPGGGATAKYGQAQCGAFTSGVHNGWNCDAALWNLNADGTPQPEVQGGAAEPGKLYNLRDVDCEDGSNGLGVPLGLGALGVAPCVAYGS